MKYFGRLAAFLGALAAAVSIYSFAFMGSGPMSAGLTARYKVLDGIAPARIPQKLPLIEVAFPVAISIPRGESELHQTEAVVASATGYVFHPEYFGDDRSEIANGGVVMSTHYVRSFGKTGAFREGYGQTFVGLIPAALMLGIGSVEDPQLNEGVRAFPEPLVTAVCVQFPASIPFVWWSYKGVFVDGFPPNQQEGKILFDGSSQRGFSLAGPPKCYSYSGEKADFNFVAETSGLRFLSRD